MKKMNEVRITEDPAEAAHLAASRTPYIVWLNDRNKEACFPSGAYCVERLSDIDAQYLDRVYRRFHNLPWEIAETPRVRIREITVKDVPQLYELYRDASITAFMEPLFADPEQEIAYTKDYIENVYGFYGYGMWVLEEKKSGQVIGRAGLENHEGFEGLELGFMLGVAYQHQGYAYEACSAILTYGLQELGQQRYCCYINEKNYPSIRLCERLGFEKQGIRGCSTLNSEYIQYIFEK